MRFGFWSFLTAVVLILVMIWFSQHAPPQKTPIRDEIVNELPV